MALYGCSLRCGFCIPKDQDRSSQLMLQSKHILGRTMCMVFQINSSNKEEAFRMLSTECDASEPFVQYLLGECLWYQFGCECDREEAARCFARAGNHVPALVSLANTIWGRPRVPLEGMVSAAQLYRQAAEQGFAPGQYKLGETYELGVGIPKDQKQAEYWMQMAAAQGHEGAIEWCLGCRSMFLS
eukprot:TRINITY_DN5212_c1_g3_i1.p1 TRINITY_DN5212_c1_g3~~TRINITY_DN5212_c1_g3_i1.p1  ORF type:complete len:213 (+),score=30.77 TRINITY_DN5212_c1_g3_i1:82-639(+)